MRTQKRGRRSVAGIGIAMLLLVATETATAPLTD
jgi:hypothetical protein